jgi:hypothetical protein
MGLSRLPFPEPGATFFSTLAYPAVSSARDRFWSAIYRWAILEQCRIDADWKLKPQLIRPEMFARKNIDKKAFTLGKKILHHQFIAAHFLVLPNLKVRRPGRAYERFERLTPTKKHMTYLAMKHMGLGYNSKSTFHSRIWAPSRPVVHAAAAYLLWKYDLANEVPMPDCVDPLFPCLLDHKILREMVLISEIIRVELPLISELEIKEEETIQFLPD